ncbi:esterase/lipase family protein [Umezawaea endophytica]|uniref:GPI inositol-deacylase n=1 Tax=Umezawaea endophytica TaxID=1654476 RepID=A0A9X2VUI4_9PSEU|nr:GPI inositol-deacylase [Umezawaea endophytica]MCS7482960.1 GPI inositol-deacylase [Umezawaea endophytica]
MALGPATPIPATGRLGVDLVPKFLGTLLGVVRALPDHAASKVRLPSALVKSEVGQRMIGFANGAISEQASVRGDALPAAMSVRLDHRRIHPDRASLAAAYPSAKGRLVVFLHGLVDTERSWFHTDRLGRGRPGTDLGDKLATALPCTPVYVRYNSGRHVSDNGRELADLLDLLVDRWPVDVTDIVLVGHSMGGLVARSAVHQAHARTIRWSSLVTRLVCLGTPHTGAPLERSVARLAGLLARVRPAAPLSWLLALRSDGIKDLAEGYLHEHQWADDDVVEQVEAVLPNNVRQLHVSATLSRSENSVLGRVLGDLMVSPSSAADPEQNADRRWLGGLTHFDLLRHDDVHQLLLDWLSTTGAVRTRLGQPVITSGERRRIQVASGHPRCSTA